MTSSPKPKKKKSLSQRLKDSIKRSKRWESAYHQAWEDVYSLRREVNELRSLIPLKYYKITYQIKANDNSIVKNEEIIDSPCPEFAIRKLKEAKTHPSTFKLINLQLLA